MLDFSLSFWQKRWDDWGGEYGKRLLPRLAESLNAEFWREFDERNLRNMRAYFLVFSIWNALRTKLNWMHFRTLLCVEYEHTRRWCMGEVTAQTLLKRERMAVEERDE